MKSVNISALVIGAAVLFSACTKIHAQPAAAPEQPQPASSWPMTFRDGSTSYTVFQPQCDSWDGHQFFARSAVAVQPAGQSQPTYGVVNFSAITLVDKSARTATLANFRVTSADFPSAREQAQNYLASIAQNISQGAPALALDSLETSLNVTQPPKHDHLNNTPPKIIIAGRPSVLVYVDGSPAWRPVPGTDLQRVINTRMLLLKDSAGKYYLHLFDGYLQAPALQGPWTVASEPPAGAAVAEQQATDSGQVDLMKGTPDAVTQKIPALSSSPVPDVIVSTKPAELIQFRGPPEFSSIPDTDLLYAGNTSGNIFKSLTDQQNYVLISGRWYRAPSLDGPWEFVPGNQLPRDFADIPDSSPKENVKASVPGTPQAGEALIANSIPQSAAVPRNRQMAPPQIDGSPQLAPIAGTPLHYVVNSATPIIQEDPQSWYACQDGVWYASASANGPWDVATFVPSVIYTIPPNSPLHYVTYVHVYGSSGDQVYDGYTPGYLGTEVAEGGTVVYGTGYYYDPWVGSVWYGPPVTWGWGFYDCWTPWWGWGFGPGFGWGWGYGWGGCFPPAPWWCGFRDFHRFHDFDHRFDRDGSGRFAHRSDTFARDGNRWTGNDRAAWASTSADIYRHKGEGRFTAGGVNATASPRKGEANGLGQSYNSRTGWLQAGQHASIQNVSGATWSHAPVAASRESAAGSPRAEHLNNSLFGNSNPALQRNGGDYTVRSYNYNQSTRTFESPRFQSQIQGPSPSRGGSWFGRESRGSWSAAPQVQTPNLGPGAAIQSAPRGGNNGWGGGESFNGGGGGGFHGGGGGGGGGHRK